MTGARRSHVVPMRILMEVDGEPREPFAIRQRRAFTRNPYVLSALEPGAITDDAAAGDDAVGADRGVRPHGPRGYPGPNPDDRPPQYACIFLHARNCVAHHRPNAPAPRLH